MPGDGTLAADLIAALGEIAEIPKTREATVPTKSGGSYSYTFADLADVLAAARPILAAHHLALLQDVTTDADTVAVATVFLHTSGETLRFGPLALPWSGTPQAMGSAITYARRYSALAALGIAAVDDDDGQGAARGMAEGPRKASDSQIRTLEHEIELRGLPDGEEWPDYTRLTMRAASDLIDRVKARPLETPPPVRAASTRAPEQAGAAASSPEDSALPPEAGPPGDDARPWNRRAYPFIAGSDVRGRYWKMVAAALPGIGDTRLLNVARDIATERGLPVPVEMGDVTEPELVDALRKWADARADEKGVAV